MITIFNRKILAKDSSPEEIARIKLILQQNDIPFESFGKRSRSIIGTNIDVGVYQKFNMPYREHDTHVTFTYHIYVKRRDYDKAYALVF